MSEVDDEDFGAQMYQDFSTATLDKARRLVDTERIVPDEDHPESIFWAKGSTSKTYRVQIGENRSYVTCTCPHGMHAGGGMTRCYHGAAALILVDRKTIASRGFGADE